MVNVYVYVIIGDHNIQNTLFVCNLSTGPIYQVGTNIIYEHRLIIVASAFDFGTDILFQKTTYR